MKGIKHLVTCRCFLPQFKRMPSPPSHQFTVFSVLEEDEKIRVRFAQCNNCGIVHKVIDVCRSEIVPKESLGSVLTIDEIKSSIPPQLSIILEGNDVDLASWELAKFIFENQQWGQFVVLKTDEQDGMKQGKYVRIMGETFFKVENFTREEVIQ